MARKKGSRVIKNVCVICGKEFYSASKADFCVDKSTCRVKHNHAKKQAEKVAKAFMMDIDTYQVYLAFVERFPHLKEKCDVMIFDIGAQKASLVMSLMWDAVCFENAKKATK